MHKQASGDRRTVRAGNAMTESRNYRLVHGGGDTAKIPHVLIVGGGYLGMYTAKRLEKKLGAGEARITVIDPNSYMTYQPFLPEAAAGSISPRHVVVPLRKVFDRVRVLGGRVVRIDHGERTVRYEPNEGEPETIAYDHLVMAAGAVSRTLPIPGLAEWGIGLKTVEEAAHLRNHVLSRLAIADSTDARARLAPPSPPGPGRVVCRHQDRGGAAAPAQPRAQQVGHRRLHRRRGHPPQGPELRVRRGRLRRRRGRGRTGGHGPRRGPGP